MSLIERTLAFLDRWYTHLEHEAWLRRRGKSTPESRAKALAILDRPTGQAPEPADRNP
jgi:hypothetical protein